MVRAFPPEHSILRDLRNLTWLEAYATTYRYPRTQGAISEPPPVDRLVSTLVSIAALLQRLATHFLVDLAQKDSPAGSTAPPR